MSSSQSSSENHVISQDQVPMRKLKVLSVMEDRTCRKIMGAFLRNSKIEYEEVANGKEAVDLYRAGATFDAILMDQEMSVMNGIEATRTLREMGVKTKIIGISAMSESSYVKEFMEAGLDEHFVQPCYVDLMPMLKELEI